jgi:hypothetical protein
MKDHLIFFPSKQEFRAWMHSSPSPELVRSNIRTTREPRSMKSGRPQFWNDEAPPDYIELHYIDDHREYLIVRVDSPFRVVVRCDESSAYFRWIYADQTIYATYLFDQQAPPPGLVEGYTLQQAKGALSVFLDRNRKKFPL